MEDCYELHGDPANNFCPKCGIKANKIDQFVKHINKAYSDFIDGFWTSDNLDDFFHQYDVPFKFTKKTLYLIRCPLTETSEFMTFARFKRKFGFDQTVKPDDLHLFSYHDMTHGIIVLDFIGYMTRTWGEWDLVKGIARLKIVVELPEEIKDNISVIHFIEELNTYDIEKDNKILSIIAETVDKILLDKSDITYKHDQKK